MSAYPYTGQLSANVGGGFGGLPVRKSVISTVASTADSFVFESPTSTIVSEGGGGTMAGVPSCIELGDGTYLAASLPNITNLSLRRFTYDNSSTGAGGSFNPSLILLGSPITVPLTSGTGASALLCNLGNNKVLLVATENTNKLGAWILYTSTTTPTVGTITETAAISVYPYHLIEIGNNTALLMSFPYASTTPEVRIIDCNGATPVITLATNSGSAFATCLTNGDTDNKSNLIKLSNTSFLYTVVSSATTCYMQAFTLSGTTITKSTSVALPLNSSSTTPPIPCRISDIAALVVYVRADLGQTPTVITGAKIVEFTGSTVNTISDTVITPSYYLLQNGRCQSFLIPCIDGTYLLGGYLTTSSLICSTLKIDASNTVSFSIKPKKIITESISRIFIPKLLTGAKLKSSFIGMIDLAGVMQLFRLCLATTG